MRFVDVRNLLGKTFCDYLLTKNENFRKLYLTMEVPEEFQSYKEQKVNYYETFVNNNVQLLPIKDITTLIKVARFLNEDGQYFEAHEVVEKYWLNYTGGYKKFLQALIQVAIANMHLEANNTKGYKRMKELALKNLEPFKGNLFGVDVEQLKEVLKREEETFLSF